MPTRKVENRVKIDTIPLSDTEYQECLDQGQQLFETMTRIYDDLCAIHVNQPKLTCGTLSVICVSMIAIGLILKILFDASNDKDAPGLIL